MKILDGRLIAQKISDQIKEEIKTLNLKPKMTIFQVGNLLSSNKYINIKTKKAHELGVEIELKNFPDSITEEELISNIKNIVNDTNGIIVQLPLPKNFNTENVLNSIPFSHDVDGLAKDNKNITPATPRGILTLLNEYKVNFKDKEIHVVGESDLVGKPTAKLLMKQSPKTVITHNKSTGINGTENADILIVAAGHKHLIKKENVKENSIIVDVGINVENDQIYGDVDFEDVKDKVSYISPVPGGVGPMTVISLFQNLLDIVKEKK